MLISTVCWGPLNHVELRSGAGLVSPRVWSASQCNCKVTLSRKDIDYLVEFHNCEFQDSVSCQKHDELDSKSANEHSRTKCDIVSKHLPDRTNRLLIQLSRMLKISILSHRAIHRNHSIKWQFQHGIVSKDMQGCCPCLWHAPTPHFLTDARSTLQESMQTNYYPHPAAQCMVSTFCHPHACSIDSYHTIDEYLLYL